ncbi:envelope stress sensor histidine kinase CpxA [Conservatibacter flavescens]|uniref:histidine kinase n=1 Tax=Conservatibacter flavescens TaxID=28161 RepID=A0A2M8S0J5_9PAST|nr:envelope stress sensor histidine kinase CpxA [Conservatibacter flavescens]PJG84669.1 two-component system sensor histidine kinase CpxA [Conservatibacter flavescens]
MRLPKLKLQSNSLTVQIFALFWLTFAILLAIVFFVPTLDARAYTELKGEELRYYQKELIISLRNNRILNVLTHQSEQEVDLYHPLDGRSDIPRPVLVNKDRNIIGASPNDVLQLQKFIYQSDNPLKPLTKRFYNIQISGPFLVHLGLVNEQSHLVYFVRTADPQQEFVSFIFDHPFFMLLLIMVISSPLLLWLAWSIGKPVRELRLSANAVASGDFTINKKLEQQGATELRLVGRSFNHMTQSLEELISNQQRLLSAISHELRTPLTRLQLAAALMRRRQGENAELYRIDTETERLDKMINDLLLLSRNQLNNHLLREIFPIQEIWEDIFSDAEFEAEQRSLSFTISQQIQSPEQHSINGNISALSSAVENVLRNSLKYTNNTITATIYIENKMLFIRIDDDGPGVPDDECERIFQPFYRVDAARTRETGGTGLGLAIVANIIQQHQGEVWAQRSSLGGLQVTIMLPLWIEQ